MVLSEAQFPATFANRSAEDVTFDEVAIIQKLVLAPVESLDTNSLSWRIKLLPLTALLVMKLVF